MTIQLDGGSSQCPGLRIFQGQRAWKPMSNWRRLLRQPARAHGSNAAAGLTAQERDLTEIGAERSFGEQVKQRRQAARRPRNSPSCARSAMPTVTRSAKSAWRACSMGGERLDIRSQSEQAHADDPVVAWRREIMLSGSAKASSRRRPRGRQGLPDQHRRRADQAAAS